MLLDIIMIPPYESDIRNGVAGPKLASQIHRGKKTSKSPSNFLKFLETQKQGREQTCLVIGH